MTDVVDTPAAPPGHYYTELAGRQVLVKNVNAAQSMILGKVYRSLQGRNTEEDRLAAFGQLAALLDALIVLESDRIFLENKVLAGELLLEHFAAVFKPLPAEQPEPARKPRRGR